MGHGRCEKGRQGGEVEKGEAERGGGGAWEKGVRYSTPQVSIGNRGEHYRPQPSLVSVGMGGGGAEFPSLVPACDLHHAL